MRVKSEVLIIDKEWAGLIFMEITLITCLKESIEFKLGICAT